MDDPTVRDVLEGLEELVDIHGHWIMDMPVKVGSDVGYPMLRVGPSTRHVSIPLYERRTH